MVKEELTSEEKFFEKAVMTEKFIKKYKNIMIASVVGVVVFVVGSMIYTSMQESRVAEANELLTELQKDSNNSVALASLESLSPALHDVWSYSVAVANKDVAALEALKKSKATLIADLASYEQAQQSADLKTLEKYTKRQNGIYVDLATLQAAVILIQKDEIQKAHTKLQTIKQDSALFEIASKLMHYGVK